MDAQDQRVAVQRFLKEIGWRDDDERARRDQAHTLVFIEGLTVNDLARLWAHAKTIPKIKKPIALFTKWITTSKWRDILHELDKSKRRQA